MDRLDVAEIPNTAAERTETLLETRVADRGRAHVDPAPALPEIERRADHGDRTGKRCRHDGEVYGELTNATKWI